MFACVKGTFRNVRSMSALPPKADIGQCCARRGHSEWDEPCRLDLPEFEARSHSRVDHLVAERLPGEIVEAITGAMRCDQIIRIDLLEFLDRLRDVIIVQRRHDMKAADYRMHLANAGSIDRLPYGINHAAMAARSEHHQPFVLDQIAGADLVLEIVLDIGASVLVHRHFLRKTAETVNDTDDLFCSPCWIFEGGLPNTSGREGVVDDNRRLRRHHQSQIGVEDRLTVKRAVIAEWISANTKAILAADIERNVAFELAFGRLEEPNHAAEMIVVAV